MPLRRSVVRNVAVGTPVVLLVAAAFVALTPAGPAQAETVTLAPIEDTYVNQGAPSSNFGAASSLSSRGSPGAISYLRFAVPAAPVGSVLSGVTLRIKSSSDPAATSVDSHTVSLTAASWSDSTTTWNTRAAITGPQVGTIAPVSQTSTVVSTALDPSPIVAVLGTVATLTVTSTGTDGLYFWSSNHATASYRPALLLTFDPATPVTTTTAPVTTTVPVTTTTTTVPPVSTTSSSTSQPGTVPGAPTDLTADGPTALTLADPPRVSVLHQQSSSIVDAVHLAPDDPRLTYRGASGFAFGSSYPDTLMYLPSSRYPHAYGSQSSFSVDFSTNAPTFEMFFKQKPSGMFRLLIDGRRTTALPQATGATTSSGLYLLKFEFTTAVTRRITLDLVSVPFGGINLTPGSTVTKVTSSEVRWAVLGDSISGGSAENVGYAQGTWVPRFGLLTGWRDGFNEALGGTGYVNPGTTAVFADRVDDDVIAYNPQKVIVWGGYNDLGSSQTTIATAATAVLSRIRSRLPGATVYVVGTWSPTGSPWSSIRSTDTTLRSVATSLGMAFVSPVTGTVYDGAGSVVSNLGPWITGTGRSSSPKGDGNADVYVGSDGVHPTDAGHSHLAMKLAASVSALNGVTPAAAGVDLHWNAPASDGAGSVTYEVHRSNLAGFVPKAATLIGTTAGTSFVVPADEPGTWWYRVVAVDGSGARSAGATAVPRTVVDDTTYPVVQRVHVPTIFSVTPNADTYVNQSAPTTNYGTTSSLGARGSTSAVAYLSFALPATPSGKSLTSATLTVRTNNDATGGSTDTFELRLTSVSWSETGMTWNNRAAVNGATIGSLGGAVAANSSYTATLAPAALAGLAGTSTTLVVTSTTGSTDSLYLWSRNYATAASRPTLTLTYS